MRDFKKFRKISKIFDFFTTDLKKFAIVLENFAKSRCQFDETRKKKLARNVRSKKSGYRIQNSVDRIKISNNARYNDQEITNDQETIIK
jgi:hypothetical protein